MYNVQNQEEKNHLLIQVSISEMDSVTSVNDNGKGIIVEEFLRNLIQNLDLKTFKGLPLISSGVYGYLEMPEYLKTRIIHPFNVFLKQSLYLLASIVEPKLRSQDKWLVLKSTKIVFGGTLMGLVEISP